MWCLGCSFGVGVIFHNDDNHSGEVGVLLAHFYEKGGRRKTWGGPNGSIVDQKNTQVHRCGNRLQGKGEGRKS